MTVALVTVTGAVLSKGTEVTVVERATTDAVIDVGETGDTIGDMLAFGNDLYDAENSAVVGRDQGQCFRNNPGSAGNRVDEHPRRGLDHRRRTVLR